MINKENDVIKFNQIQENIIKKECTFKPDINKISKYTRAKFLEENNNNKQKNIYDPNCTFKPKTNKVSNS